MKSHRRVSYLVVMMRGCTCKFDYAGLHALGLFVVWQIKVSVDSSAGKLMAGQVDGVVVEGEDWASPKQAHTPPLHVTSLTPLLDPPFLLHASFPHISCSLLAYAHASDICCVGRCK